MTIRIDLFKLAYIGFMSVFREGVSSALPQIKSSHDLTIVPYVGVIILIKF